MAAESNHPEALRDLFHALFDDHAAHIALLDLTGRILAWNPAWMRFALQNGLRSDYDFAQVNYLDVCDHASQRAEPYAQEALVGLLAVLRDAQPRFSMLYPCHSPTEQRWFRMSVRSSLPEAPALIVAHSLLIEKAMPARPMASIPPA
jgi:hypothetical protein